MSAVADEEKTVSLAQLERLPGWGDLTKREKHITERVVLEGMTNPQLARAEFVTVQTIKFHLANSYRKLKVSGRKEISRLLAA